jgi:hypothetical protein
MRIHGEYRPSPYPGSPPPSTIRVAEIEHLDPNAGDACSLLFGLHYPADT